MDLYSDSVTPVVAVGLVLNVISDWCCPIHKLCGLRIPSVAYAYLANGYYNQKCDFSTRPLYIGTVGGHTYMCKTFALSYCRLGKKMTDVGAVTDGLQNMKIDQQYVYLVCETNSINPNGPLNYKVGQSGNPVQRLPALQTGNPRKLEFVPD